MVDDTNPPALTRRHRFRRPGPIPKPLFRARDLITAFATLLIVIGAVASGASGLAPNPFQSTDDGPDGTGSIDVDSSFADDDVIVTGVDAAGVIQRFARDDGSVLGSFVEGDEPVQAAQAAVLGADGLLYVADASTDRVVRFDPADNTPVDVFISAGAEGLDEPRGLAFGSDGTLYVVSAAGGEVMAFDGDTGALSAVVADGLANPAGAAIDADGRLYVAEQNADAIAIIALDSGRVGTLVTGPGSAPTDVTFDNEGLLYVALSEAGRIDRFDPALLDADTPAEAGAGGDVVPEVGDDGRTSGFETVVAEELAGPTGLAVDGTTIWVADYWNDDVRRFDLASGEPLGEPIGIDDAFGPTDVVFLGSAAGLGPDPVPDQGDADSEPEPDSEPDDSDADDDQPDDGADDPDDDQADDPDAGAAVDLDELTDGNRPPDGFELNAGQFDDEIDAVFRVGDRALTLVDGHLLVDTPSNPGGGSNGNAIGRERGENAISADRPDNAVALNPRFQGNVVSIGLVDADPDVTPVGRLGEVGPVRNYFVGDTEAVGVTAHPQLLYRDLLPGVDVRYIARPDGVTYDILLDAGVDPGSLSLAIDGGDRVRVDGQGRLVVSQPTGPPLRFSAPVSYQTDGVDRLPVTSRYTLNDDGTIGFELEGFDPRRPLVIDPTLDLSSYIGGTGDDMPRDVAIDGSGNVLIIGDSTSSNYPTSAGAYDTTANGNPDIVVSALDPTGSTLLWSTFVGGSGADYARELAVATDGTVYVVGNTSSTNFPTTGGAYDTTSNGATDAVVVALSSSGAALTASTFLGSSNSDDAESVDLDSAGNVVVLGNTQSTAFPTTGGAYDTTHNGVSDLFVAKLNASLTSLTWSTFVGGSGSEAAGMIDVDGSGGVWFVTGTGSSNMATSAGAFDTALSGSGDFWVGGLSSSGSALTFGTYLGGSGADVGPSSIYAVDATELHVASSATTGYPTTTGAYDETASSSDTGYVVFDSTATGSAQLTYGSALGGTGGGYAHDITVDASGRAYIAGDVSSSGLATAGAPDTTLSGSWDGSLAVMDPVGATLEFYTYIGGSANGELATGVALNAAGEAVVTGYTDSSNLTTTGGAYQTASGGGSDGFVQRYSALPGGGGQLGRWRLDEGSGTTALDSSGNGNDGTLVNGPTYITAVSSTGLSFAGDSGEGVEVPDPVDDSLDPGSGEIAVETWMRVSAAPANGISHPLVTKLDFQDDPSIDGFELALYGDGGAGRLFFKLWDNAPSSQASGVWQAFDATNDWVDGQWHHVVGQINGSNVELWVDGTLVASSAHSAGTIIADNPLRFGVDQFGTNDYDGDLDEISVYGSALTSAEIAAAAAAGPSAGGGSVVLDNIQDGTTVLSNGSSSTTATISAVDTTKSFLTYSIRGSDSDPQDIWVTGVLTNSTTITFAREGTQGNVTIEWAVTEFSSGVTVQRGVATMSATPTDVTITGVDLSTSFPLINHRAGGTVFGENDFVSAQLTSSTNLRLATAVSTFSNVVPWQVVTYDDATVQSGTVAFGTTESSDTATITAVDTSKSWLAYTVTSTDGTATDIGQKMIRGRLTNSTTLTFDRYNTGQAMEVTWYLVEFTDSTEVQHSSASFASGTSTATATLATPVDRSRSIATGGYLGYGGRTTYNTDDNPGYGWFTTDLVSATELEIRRGVTGASADLGWFAIEWVCADSDSDGVTDCHEDANTDGDNDPTTNPGPDTDGDTTPNYLDADDDGDGTSTASENADPNSDGDPRDALDTDHDGQPDYLDPDAVGPSSTPVADEQKISDTQGGLAAVLDDSDGFGRGVASIGDLDGDGVTDLAVGVWADDDGGTNRGAVHVLFMNANGTVRAEQKISDTQGGLAAVLDNGDSFGHIVDTAGDLDGDGVPDLVVGALGDDDGGTDRGAVYLLFMNANGTVRAEQKISDTQGGLAAVLDDSDQFGHHVAGIGDLDGDGLPDIAVGAWGDDDGGSSRGAVHVLFMNANGTVRAEQKISDTQGGLAAVLDDDDRFGHALARIGDLDADGVTDLAVGAKNDDDGGGARGAVHVLFMNSNGTVRAEQKISDTAGGFTATLDDLDQLGSGLAGVGDIDGNGTPDLVAGAWFDGDGGSNRGAVYLLMLAADGTVTEHLKISDTAGGLGATLDNEDHFGASVASIGDLDGDGTLNIVVGASGDDDGGSSRGSAYVLDLTSPQAIVDAVDDSGAAYSATATVVNAAGNDVDADGDAVTVVDVTDPANGTASTNGDGTVTYTSDPAYTGADGFDYWAIDVGAPLSHYWGLAGNGSDAVGSSNGTLTGTTTVAGNFGQALSFDEIDDRVTVPDFAYGSDFTLSFDFKVDDNTGTLFQYIYSHGDVNGTNSVNVLLLEGSHGTNPNTLRTVIRDGDDTLDNFALDVNVASFIADGQWHHYAATVDSGGITVYVDGVAAASDPTRGTGTVNPSGSLYLGARQDLNVDRYYGGSLDTVQIYDRALGASEVADLDSQVNVATVTMTVTPCDDTDTDGLCDNQEDADSDADGDPSTNPGPDTDGDTTPNYLDADDDGDGTPTSAENADPNGDGDPRDAKDSDRDGQPDYLDVEAGPSATPIADEQKISDTAGGLAATLDDSDRFGRSVAGVGDVDGDGVADLAVGAQYDDDGGSNRGAVYVLFLNADGTVKAEQKISDTSGGLTATLDDADSFGYSVAGVGDVDGDGVADLAVGAHRDDDGGSDRGAVYVLFLNADGTVRAEQKISDTAGGLAATLDDADYFGRSVAGVGDVDGDGVADVAVGAYYDDDGGSERGAVYVLFLNADGTVRAEQKISDTAGGLAATLDDADYFGISVAGLGDLDGDGQVNLAVGAHFDDDGGTGRGAVHVLDLSVHPCAVDSDADGLWDCEEDANIDLDNDPATNPGPDTDGDTTPNYLDADDDGDGTPTSAENADPNGDGDPRDALDVDRDGQPDYLDVEAGSSSTPIADEQKISDTTGGFTATLDDGDRFGNAVAAIGDIDGDGTDDVIVGARDDDDGGNGRGAVHVLFLNPDGTVKAEQKISDTAGGFTTTLDDADRFGVSVAGVGDLDGDGVSDVVVGADLDDDGGSDHGAVYVLFLNADGTVKAEQKISDTTGGFTTTLDSDFFGHRVAGLGDVDGDGINDIAVAAILDDDGGGDHGAVYVLFLNADGTVKAEQKISDTAGGFTSTMSNGNRFGTAVAGIGDLDGDGIVDLAVGAHNHSIGDLAGGAVFILLLNADGTVKAEQKISGNAGGLAAVIEDYDRFGSSAAGVGDLNDDGVPDLVVGAHDDDGGVDRGALYLLFLNTDGTVKGEQKISDTTGGLAGPLDDSDFFGFAAAGVGDLDGDGTTNLLVGANLDDDGGTDRGAIYLLDLSVPNTAPIDISVEESTHTAEANPITVIGSQTGSTDTSITLASGRTVDLTSTASTVDVTIREANGDLVDTVTVVDYADSNDLFGGTGPVGVLAAHPDGGFVVATRIRGYIRSGWVGSVVSAHVYDADGNHIVHQPQYLSGGNVPLIMVSGTSGSSGTGTFRENPTIDIAGDGTITVSWNNTTEAQFEQRVFTLAGPTVAEDAADGTVIATVSGVDPDPGDTLTFDIVGGDTNFEIVGTQLRVKAGNNLDYETATSHTFTVRVTDSTGNSYDEALTIAVENVADPVVGVNSTGDATDTSLGDDICDTGATNANGDPECTLRAAIAEANASAIVDTIHFNIPATDTGHVAGTWTITPSSALPLITAPVTIDGTTQTGSTAASTVFPAAMDSTLSVELSGSSLSAGTHGLVLDSGSDGSEIRGIAFTDVTGGTANAISIVGSSNNVIAGNHFGVSADGTTDNANRAGVAVWDASSSNRIGGTAAADRNLFGGQTYAHIQLSSSTTLGTIVRGNDLGYLSGGADASTNPTFGVVMWDGTTATIGGPGLGEGNRIRGAATGVLIDTNGAPAFATIVGNHISDTTVAGIDLLNGGLTANDPGDGDSGPNDLLNFPVITNVGESGGTLTVDFDLDAPAGNYRIEFFTNPSGAGPGGYGNGELFAHGETVTHTGSGAESFSASFAGSVTDVLTATTTQDLGGGSFGWTSEFSAAEIPSIPLTINSTGDDGDNTNGDGVCDTGGTNSEGDPECTLRAAIEEANGAAIVDYTVSFNIPISDPNHSAGVWTTTAGSAYPVLSQGVAIDAQTQPGWTSTPVFEIDVGGLGGPNPDGFRINTATEGVTLRGLAFTAVKSNALEIQSGTGHVFAGNHFGTNAAGTVATNTGGGALIWIEAGSNITIGGTAAEDRNLITSGPNGIVADGSGGVDGLTIQGNYIGTDVTGNAPLGTIDFDAIRTVNGVTNITVGGSAAGAGNVLTTGTDGVQIDGEASDNAVVEGNLIGVGADGTTALSVGVNGVFINNGADSPSIVDNVIGNAGVIGIEIDGTTVGGVIQGNRVGIDAGGNPHPIQQMGVLLDNGNGNVTGMLVGGTALDERNTIANAGAGGTWTSGIYQDSTGSNTFLGNSIVDNAGLAIDLAGGTEDSFGVTANDASDGDTGPNDLLNFPVITAISEAGGTLTVDYTFDAPAGTYRVEFFDNAYADDSSHGEAQTYAGSQTIIHTGSGAEPFSTSFSGQVTDILAATATEDLGGGSYGATSELSAVASLAAAVNSTGDVTDANPGDHICDTGATNADGNPECTLRAAIAEANASSIVNEVAFDIPNSDLGYSAGDGTWTITVGSLLPNVTAPITIDGSGQAGHVANTAPAPAGLNGTVVVVVDGGSTVTSGFFFAAGSDGSLVRDLVVSNFTGAGMHVANGADNVSVAGNRIGTDAAGTAAEPATIGVFVQGAGAAIGGGSAADRNLISGNSDVAVRYSGVGAQTGVVQGNLIGTDVTGLAPLPNTNWGVMTDNGAGSLTLGTDGDGIDDATEGNVIGGSGTNVVLTGSANVVAGNHIGVGSDGTSVLSGGGVSTAGTARIGSDWDGQSDGVEGNIIASNSGAGVRITGTSDVTVLGNSIGNNGGLGIDLNDDGVTTNDAGDADSGPNDLLNFPVITAAEESGGTVSVDIDLDAPAGDHRIELFLNPSGADPSGHGEGETYVGAFTVTHTGSGVETFSTTYAGIGNVTLTATATEDLGGGAYGATSEFSPARVVCADGDGDGLCARFESLYGDTDGDTLANENDTDDDNDGTPTASENADPNADGDPRDALDADRDGQADYLDLPTSATGGVAVDEQKISDTSGGLGATLDDVDNFGRSVTAIGDLDGNGVVDLAVGADSDDDGAADAGAVHILFLNAGGSVIAEQKISATTGGLTGPLEASDGFGRSVAAIGDVDGDGVVDLAVGAHLDDDGTADAGAVYVLFLNSDGTVKAEQKISAGTGGFADGLGLDHWFGSSVSGLGDLNGDGLPDLAVGTPGGDDGGTDRGEFHVLFLNADGTVKAEQKVSQSAGGGPGLDDSDRFGISVTALGDVDGDGLVDVAVGADGDDDGGTDRGAVHVTFLNADGTVKGTQKISDSAGGFSTTLGDSDAFGRAVSGVGDLDGDGVGDLAVGAPLANLGGTDAGAVYVLFLNSDGTVRVEQQISDLDGGLVEDLGSGDNFGTSVTGLGDLDGDGTIGLAVGAGGDDDGGTDRGAAYVLDLSDYNNAPVLDNTGAMILDPIDKTNFNSAGNTVAQIIASAGGDRITDADGDPEGIMITDATSSDNGWFDFSLDGGTTWTRFGWYWNGLLLRDTDMIRFVPTGFTAETGTLTIRAWDQTTGTAGTALRTYGTGGTAPFSSATESVTITTTDVNQAPTFGTGGTAGVAGGSTNLLTWDREGASEDFKSVAEAPDGSFFITSHLTGDSGSDEVLLVKLTAAGSVDTGFGDGGHVLVSLGAGADRGNAIAVQPDGKIVVAGQSVGTTWDGVVARFNADGTLDTSFGGGDGWATVDLGGGEYFEGVAVHSDGTIYAGGGDAAHDLFVARFLADGTLDPAFGTGGSVVHAAHGRADDLAVDSTGRAVIPTEDNSGSAGLLGVIRLTTSGALDTSFDTDGVAYTDLGLVDSAAYGEGVAVLGDDRIVVTGTSWDSVAPAWEDDLSRIPIAQFTTTGAPDPTFGGGSGYVLADVPGGGYWGAAEAIAVAPDGDLVTGGYHDVGYKGQNDAVVSRHLADGSLDSSFTGDGIDVARTGRYWNYLYDVAVGSTGTIVAVGLVSWGDGLILVYDAAGNPVAVPATNTLDGTPTFLAYGAPVVMDDDVRVFDKELIDRADWSGSSLTITRQGGADATDVLAASGLLSPLTEGGALVYDGVTVGTVTTNSGGTLQLDFDTGSTEALVTQVMQALAYRNTTANTGVVTMEWTFADGDGGTDTGTVDVTIALTGITVNSTGDGTDTTPGDEICDTGGTNSEGDPECTLRAAIEELNAIGGGDIDFNIPVTDTGHVYYQDNAAAGFATPVATVAADDSLIVDFDADYPLTPFSWWRIAPATELPAVTGTISIDGTTQPGHQPNTVAGTGPLDAILRVEIDNPSTALSHGLQLSGSGIEVRGLVIDEGDDAITIDTNGAATIAGNWLGPDVTGDRDGAPTGAGLSLTAGAGGNTIGGPTPADRNVLAHTSAHGLYLASDGNTITNNYLGFGSLGTSVTAPSAQGTGIWLIGSNNQIGDVVGGNVIGRNIDSGIWAPDGTGNRIQGNTFIANQDTSITFTGTSGQNLVGGDGAGEGNLITATTVSPGIGVTVDSTSTDNTIIGNSITGNDGLAVDLGGDYGDGVTPNDGGDVDGGANDGLNFPVLTAPTEGDTTVDLTLDVPAGDYRIEVFTNPTEGADPSGHGEGETLVAAQTMTHTGSGSEPFSLAVPTVFAGDVLTATATEDLGGGAYASTSEFSAAVTVAAPTDPVLDASVRRSDLNAFGGLDPATASGVGYVGSAMTFDGTDDLLSGPPLNVNDQALTVSAWIQADAFTGTDHVVSKQTAGGNPIYELGVNGGTGQVVATLRIGGSPVVVQGGSVSAGTAHHLTVTWDGTTVALYVDGAVVDTAGASGSLATDVTTNVAIGNRAGGTTGFDGDIDHVEIIHTAWSADHIALRQTTVADQALTVTVGQQQTGTPGAWTVSGAQSRSGGFSLAAPETTVGAPAWAVATGIDEPGAVFESWWWSSTALGVDFASGTRAGSSPTDQFDAAYLGADVWNLRRRSGATVSSDAGGSQTFNAGTWVKVEQWTDQTGQSRLFVDGTEVIGWTAQTSPPSTGSVGLRVGQLPNGETWFIDDPRARRLVMPEPTSTLSALDRN